MSFPAILPATFESTGSGLPALLHTAACTPLPHLGWIRVTGSDRVRWLNGMVTNSIQSLSPGQGCYNFVLSAQGRIQADLTAFLSEDSILLETRSDRIPGLLALLDRFIIMDDVELDSVSSHSAGLLVAGPEALSSLVRLLDLPADLVPLQAVPANWQGSPVYVIYAHSPLVPRYELWFQNPESALALQQALTAQGLPLAFDSDLETLRILEGTPLFGTDIRDKDLPQETAQTRALHFSKGCYLGQEIVERIHSRGNVHRTFSGFRLSGTVPPPGTPLFSVDAPEKQVGELTSVTVVGKQTFALGYIRRETLNGTPAITFNGGHATPTPLPFQLANAHLTA